MSESSALPIQCDVAVVGGGPAGLAAATRLKQRGAGEIVVIERETEAGGIPRHCGHSPYGLREFRRLLSGKQYAARLVKEARDTGVTIECGHNVVDMSAGPDPELTVTGDGRVRTITCQRVILATGVREQSRAARLIGGRRSLGILSTGALQSLVYLKGMLPFTNPVILGTELVSFSSLLTCRHAGANPAAMIEPNDRITAWGFARGLPALLGVPVHLGTEVLSVIGEDRVEGVLLKLKNGTLKPLSCDGVVVSGQFQPESSLARMLGLETDKGTMGPAVDQFGRCSDPHYFATGNLLRPVETAGWCWQEGIGTAGNVYRSLTGNLPPPESAVQIGLDAASLKYVVAQRVCPDDVASPPSLQLRAARRVRGHLLAEADGEAVWTGMIDTVPERRIHVPLEPLRSAAAHGKAIRIRLEEYA